MAKKVTNITYNVVPETLDNHPFYGLQLDDEQIILRDNIWDKNKDIIFVNSKAGTGKTLISIATANLLCNMVFSTKSYMYAALVTSIVLDLFLEMLQVNRKFIMSRCILLCKH